MKSGRTKRATAYCFRRCRV